MILHTQLSIENFITESNYTALQNKFASYDERLNGYDEPKFEKPISIDFTIIHQLVENEYSEISFYDTFLYPKINELAKNKIRKIQQEIETKYKYDKPKIELFIKDTLDKTYIAESRIEKAEYLTEQIIEKLSSQIKIVLEYLNGDYLNQFELNNKFQFKLLEQDLLVLIAFLRKENKLVNENESQLGHLIERNFECFDNKTQSYKKISKANKKLNEIKNNKKSIEKSIIRLRELFSENSFNNL